MRSLGSTHRLFSTSWTSSSFRPTELKAFKENQYGCVIGRKLATERKLKVGSSLPLKGDIYPMNLDLQVVGTYDGPHNRDLRMCLFRFDYFDPALKRVSAGRSALATKNFIPPCT